MRSLPLAGAALVMFSVGAVGADAPNLVGSWTRTAHTMAVLKGSSKPLFTHAEDQVWKLKINSQDNGAFSGMLTGRPVGKPQALAGAFQADGKHFVFSTGSESGSGEASSDELQYCWTSPRPVIIAGCATFKRDK